MSNKHWLALVAGLATAFACHDGPTTSTSNAPAAVRVPTEVEILDLGTLGGYKSEAWAINPAGVKSSATV